MGAGKSTCKCLTAKDLPYSADVQADYIVDLGSKTNGCGDGDQVFVESESSVSSRMNPAKTATGALNPAEDGYWLKAGKFDYDKNTEDQYCIRHFTGQHRDIRPLLDYTYHKKYREDRVQLQDRIIEAFCASGNAQKDLLLPWVIFTAGAMGAGKGYVIRWMEQKGCLPLSQFTVVDPDEIRQRLPEWGGYVARDPQTAAVKTQKEAGHIAEILGYKALRKRWNVIFDGSLRDVEWYKVYFQKLRHSFPGIRLMILHIQADREAVLQRAEERGKQTGRMVPRDLLESSMAAVPQSVRVLAPYVDVAIRAKNVSGKDPVFEHEPTACQPKKDLVITLAYLSRLWRPVDLDGDGELSKEEVQIALAQGTLTQEVLDTIDTNRDGSVSRDELTAARATARQSGTMLLRGESYWSTSMSPRDD